MKQAPSAAFLLLIFHLLIFEPVLKGLG